MEGVRDVGIVCKVRKIGNGKIFLILKSRIFIKEEG